MSLRKLFSGLLWSLCAVIGTFSSVAQHIGLPAMTTYTIEDYEGGGQNYQIAQTDQGIICVANNLGLLTFDGTHWHRYGIPGGTKVRSVLPVERRIYVGCQGEFGFMESDGAGFLHYTSLTSLIPEDHRNFEDIWKIHELEGAICFSTAGKSFLYDQESIQVIPSSGVPGFTLRHGDELLTKWENQPVQRLIDSSWVELPSQPAIGGAQLISVISSLSAERSLWFTQSDGIFLFDGQSTRPFARNLQEQLAREGINKAVLLSDNTLAVGTDLGGLHLIDGATGQEVLQINPDKGLHSRTVYDMIEDRTGSLWLSMNNAIVKISWSYPFSFIDEKIGIPGTGYAALSVGDKLYLGTNNGLFEADLNHGTIDQVRRIDGINGQINNLQEIHGQILISAHEGAFFLKGHEVVEIDTSIGWWSFVPLEDPNRLIGGCYDGLGLFIYEQGKWQLKTRYHNFNESSRVLVYAGDSTLWMTHGYKGVYRFQLSNGYDSLRHIDFYGAEDGLPSPYLNNVFDLGQEIIFTTESGVFYFDSSREHFVRHQYLDTLIGPDIHTRYLQATDNGDIYAMTQDFTGLLTSSPWTGINLDKNTFDGIHGLLNDDLAQISVIDENQVLFASNAGFVHYKHEAETLKTPLEVMLRSVDLINSDSALHGGYGSVPASTVTIPYIDNSIAFRYSSIDCQLEQCFYRYRLSGYRDEQWSDWSSETLKEYTNLREGNYLFEVQAMDILGRSSRRVSFAFSVDPPWYRSPIAYVLYVLLSSLVIFLSAAWYRGRYHRERRRLIERQRQELKLKDTALTQLQKDKLEAEIQLKQRQLASSTMHLIDKNEVMGKVKHSVTSIIQSHSSDATLTKDLKAIVKEIDRNIDQDQAWDQFAASFDEVHEGFLKSLRQEFPQITPADLKLCAYLRMNMSTKEIANLLKISVRGVEIARYRLRKKLGLESSTNLAEFMIKYGE